MEKLTNLEKTFLKVLADTPGISLQDVAARLYGDKDRDNILKIYSYAKTQVKKGRCKKDDLSGRFYLTKEGHQLYNNVVLGARNGLRPGQKVTYVNSLTKRAEHGIVDRVGKDREDGWAWVVFEGHCYGDWMNYDRYRSAACKIDNLVHGWK